MTSVSHTSYWLVKCALCIPLAPTFLPICSTAFSLVYWRPLKLITVSWSDNLKLSSIFSLIFRNLIGIIIVLKTSVQVLCLCNQAVLRLLKFNCSDNIYPTAMESQNNTSITMISQSLLNIFSKTLRKLHFLSKTLHQYSRSTHVLWDFSLFNINVIKLRSHSTEVRLTEAH